MSLSQTIGQRLAERLWKSGWLRRIEVSPQAQSLVRHLWPRDDIRLSERLLRFVLNFLGEHKRCAKPNDILVWNAAFVEAVRPEASTYRCPDPLHDHQ
jgi:hypothetical protein